MTPRPFCVNEGDSLQATAKELDRRRIGSALVLDGSGRLTGIFTEADAVRALAEIGGRHTDARKHRSHVSHAQFR